MTEGQLMRLAQLSEQLAIYKTEAILTEAIPLWQEAVKHVSGGRYQVIVVPTDLKLEQE